MTRPVPSPADAGLVVQQDGASFGPGSHEPSPKGLGPSGFDPSRGHTLEHYGSKVVKRVRSAKQGGEEDWRGKPKGLWISVSGEDDWPSWCEMEQFGQDRLAVRHVVTLATNARILWLSTVAEIDAFDDEYGSNEKLSFASQYTKRVIDWNRVASLYQGIIIAPYIWERRLGMDGPKSRQVSDWYYGWDCASGVIWDAKAVASITRQAMETGTAETEGLRAKPDSAVPEGDAASNSALKAGAPNEENDHA